MANSDTTLIHVRVKNDVKARAMSYADAVGIPLSTLVNAFITRFAADGVVPFTIAAPDVPSPELVAAMEEIDNGGGEECGTLEDMYKACGVNHKVGKKKKVV